MADDLAGLTESQRKVLKVVEAQSRKMIVEGVAELKRDLSAMPQDIVKQQVEQGLYAPIRQLINRALRKP